MIIRQATAEDAPAILDIYAPYVKDTPVSFELKTPSKTEFLRRLERISQRFPYLAAEKDGRIVGYAYAHAERERAGYQWNAELSVYLLSDYQRRGLGSRLYNAVIEILGFLGYRNLYAVITLPNDASLSMHQRLGFTPLAVHKNAGYKLGRWHDVAWLEKNLGPYRADPVPPTPIKEAAPEDIRRILGLFQG